MGRRRKYCSAQPYLDYIGISERERMEWNKEASKEFIRSLMEDVSITVDPHGKSGK